MLLCHSLHRITRQHPSQWSAVTTQGHPVFVWYKWGELKVYVGPVGGDTEDALETEAVFDAPVGHRHDCEIEWSDVVAATGIELVDGSCPAR